MSDLTTIVAAVVGSLAGGLGHFLLARRSSRLNRRAMLTGLVAEIEVLHRLLRLQFGAAPERGSRGPVTIFPITYHGKLAAVYDALSAKLGDLDDVNALHIVHFHTLYKMIVGIAEKQGAQALDPGLIAEALDLGETIVRNNAPAQLR
ncbi:MAG: hypothetical protein DI629_04035 [Mesorhizobium amorphae]|nr:MAG: hypothetical protein DI629_04035 [Mesorhizobium amorphae]